MVSNNLWTDKDHRLRETLMMTPENVFADPSAMAVAHSL